MWGPTTLRSAPASALRDRTMTELRIASFNVHWGGLQRDGAPFDAHAACLLLDADVLVVQEAWWPEGDPGWLDQLATQYAHHHELVLSRGLMRKKLDTPAPTGAWGLAVMSRYPLRHVTDLPLGEVPGDPVRERRAVHLELDVDGTVVDLVAAHISAITLIGPNLQLRRLGSQLPAGDSDRPAIVIGDLNVTWPVVRAWVGRGWRRAVVGPTWPSTRLACQIDHILVNRAVRVRDGIVYEHMGSDHRPIAATLAF